MSEPSSVPGATGDFGYNLTENRVRIHDCHATMLHCLGVDHAKLSFRFEGRDHRLTDMQGDTLSPSLGMR